MDERLARLLALSWRSVPAAEANSAIGAARREVASAKPSAGRTPRQRDAAEAGEAAPPLARSYEIVLDLDAGWAGFAANVLPKLVYHLESIGAHPPGFGGLLIALFAGDQLYFLDAKALVDEACRTLGISAAELVRLHGTGESRTAVRSGELLLPPPRGEN